MTNEFDVAEGLACVALRKVAEGLLQLVVGGLKWRYLLEGQREPWEFVRKMDKAIKQIGIVLNCDRWFGFRFRVGAGETRECVGQLVVMAGDPMEFGRELLKEESPTKNSLRIQICVNKIFMVCPDMDLGSVDQGSELLERCDDRQKLLFHCRVILLRAHELARVECNRLPLLSEDGAELKVGRVGMDVVGKVGIRIAEQRVTGEQGANGFEVALALGGPIEARGIDESDERREKVRATRDHVAVEGNRADEASKFADVSRRLKAEDGVNLFTPRADAVRR
eukprot:Pompholyxophrys_punicea_v1_NODE_80_length_3711_cov_3.592724.p2 type:complete len:281 gc:universal NODE_80_length_3711_cov_3.592724:3376-2534(-)